MSEETTQSVASQENVVEEPALESEVVLQVFYDRKNQTVRLKFETDEFKTYDFVLGVLEMAKINAGHMRNMVLARNMQQQMMMQQQQEQAMILKNNILRPRR